MKFSEKRKLAREQAKAAGGAAHLSAHSTAADEHAQPHTEDAGKGLVAKWRRRFLRFYHSKAFWLVLYSVLLLVTSVGNSIAFKKMINKMENYVSQQQARHK